MDQGEVFTVRSHSVGEVVEELLSFLERKQFKDAFRDAKNGLSEPKSLHSRSGVV